MPVSRQALFRSAAVARGRALACPMPGGFYAVAVARAPRQYRDSKLYRGPARGGAGFQAGGSRRAEAPAPASGAAP